MHENNCKVCRVIADREMEEYEHILLDQWKGNNGKRKGYRQLAEWFNTTILRREMDKAGLSTLGNEPESKYDRLKGDETIAEEVRMDLRRAGVPINEVESDFVSYGVIRTHIKDCLGEEYEHTSSDWEKEAITRARSHAKKKISEAVQAAVSGGKLEAIGDVSVNVTVELECEETHINSPVDRAMRRGYVSRADGKEPAVEPKRTVAKEGSNSGENK